MTASLAALDRAGKLNRTAVQEQFLRQRRLARVRMRNDGESPPPADFILYVWHWVSSRLRVSWRGPPHLRGLRWPGSTQADSPPGGSPSSCTTRSHVHWMAELREISCAPTRLVHETAIHPEAFRHNRAIDNPDARRY